MDQPEPLMLAVLKSFVEHQLHAKADAHHRLACRSFSLNDFRHPRFSQFSGGIFKGSDTRKDDPVALGDHLFICGHYRFSADLLQRAFEGE